MHVLTHPGSLWKIAGFKLILIPSIPSTIPSEVSTPTRSSHPTFHQCKQNQGNAWVCTGNRWSASGPLDVLAILFRTLEPRALFDWYSPVCMWVVVNKAHKKTQKPDMWATISLLLQCYRTCRLPVMKDKIGLQNLWHYWEWPCPRLPMALTKEHGKETNVIPNDPMLISKYYDQAATDTCFISPALQVGLLRRKTGTSAWASGLCVASFGLNL